MTSRTSKRKLFAGLLALWVAGCGGSSSAPAVNSGVASITPNLSAASVSAGQTVTIGAEAKDAQGNVLGGTALTWQSSNTAVATVAAGVVTGLAPGAANISASADGVTSSPVAVTVTAATAPPGTVSAPTVATAPVITVTNNTTHLSLAASQGTWANSPTAYAYGWARNGAAIPGATLAGYNTTAADQGNSVSVVVTASNSGGSASAASAAVQVPTGSGTPPNNPSLGAHGLAFHRSNGSVGATLSTPAMTTQSGSTMLAFVGKGSVFFLSPPTDNKGNTPYVQVGTIHEYTRWPGEGTAMYAFNSIVGGTNHLVSVDDSNRFDEVTFATVEVRNGGLIQDFKWNEVLNVAAQTSQSVTTTGPATLVAVWFGDDASAAGSNPVPNNGFTRIEGVGNAVETVQMFVATKDVSAAGTYNVTWNTTPLQGAQLYLVAVQKQ